MTLFDPILDPTSAQHSRLSAVDVAFVKAHGILFSNKYTDDFLPTVDKFSSMLDNHIGRTTRKWMESGYISTATISYFLYRTKTRIGTTLPYQTATVSYLMAKTKMSF